MADQRKDLPAVNASNFDARIREEVMRFLGRQGNLLDRAVTLRDLRDAKFIELDDRFVSSGGASGGPIKGPGTGVSEVPDLSPPPMPTGLAVTGALSNLIIECDPPTYKQGHGHAESVLYGVAVEDGDPLPTFADAVELARFPGTVYAYPADPSRTFRFWLKWRSRDGVESSEPAGGTNGVEGQTGQNVTRLVEALTGPGLPFKVIETPTTLPDGTPVPAGTYMSDAYMGSFVAAKGQIGLLAVDNARIANVSVDKLTAGSLLVGSYIQSANYVAGSFGFRINGAGTAEFNEVVVRGTIYASAGTFAGTLNAATGTFAGDVSGATGTFNGGVKSSNMTGYAWPPSGQRGFYLGPGGLLLGNGADGRGFQVEAATGNIYMPGLSVVNGNATFSGTLSIDNGSGTKLVIDSQQVCVYVGGALRVQLGVGF